MKVIPQKTRIVFQTRMRFAAIIPQKTQLRGHLVLPEPNPSRYFDRIESYSPGNHVHVFRISSAEQLDEWQLDEEFTGFLKAAYRVGNQEHLDRRT